MSVNGAPQTLEEWKSAYFAVIRALNASERERAGLAAQVKALGGDQLLDKAHTAELAASSCRRDLDFDTASFYDGQARAFRDLLALMRERQEET